MFQAQQHDLSSEGVIEKCESFGIPSLLFGVYNAPKMFATTYFTLAKFRSSPFRIPKKKEGKDRFSFFPSHHDFRGNF